MINRSKATSPTRSMKSGNSTKSTSSVRSMPSPKTTANVPPRISAPAPKASKLHASTMLAKSQKSPQSSFDDTEDAPIPEGLIRCGFCKRNFAEDRIEKHQVICQKTKTKKRKVYDASKKRTQVTNIGMKLNARPVLIITFFRAPKPKLFLRSQSRLLQLVLPKQMSLLLQSPTVTGAPSMKVWITSCFSLIF